jgi:hypothetical protein
VTTRKNRNARPAVGRKTIISLGALALAAGGGLLAMLARARRVAPSTGHKAPDLAPDRPHPGPEHRAPEAFRPDPTAPVPASEREAFRPATVPVSGE